MQYFLRYDQKYIYLPRLKACTDILYNKLFSSAICEPCEETQVHHPVYFNQIDGALIRSTVLSMDGATGPSGMDTAGLKHLCTAFF